MGNELETSSNKTLQQDRKIFCCCLFVKRTKVFGWMGEVRGWLEGWQSPQAIGLLL